MAHRYQNRNTRQSRTTSRHNCRSNTKKGLRYCQSRVRNRIVHTSFGSNATRRTLGHSQHFTSFLSAPHRIQTPAFLPYIRRQPQRNSYDIHSCPPRTLCRGIEEHEVLNMLSSPSTPVLRAADQRDTNRHRAGGDIMRHGRIRHPHRLTSRH